jgi:hypothetical protein
MIFDEITACRAALNKGTIMTRTRFREIYKALIERKPTLSVGSRTLAAKRMASYLKAAGFPTR